MAKHDKPADKANAQQATGMVPSGLPFLPGWRVKYEQWSANHHDDGAAGIFPSAYHNGDAIPADLIYGGTGVDTLCGGEGDDIHECDGHHLSGRDNDDSLYDDDVIWAGMIYGARGVDTLCGGEGDDMHECNEHHLSGSGHDGFPYDNDRIVPPDFSLNIGLHRHNSGNDGRADNNDDDPLARLLRRLRQRKR